MVSQQPYPRDVSDSEWQFVVPYPCLLTEDAGQRVHDLRDVFDAARWLVRSGSPWRYLPKDFPPGRWCISRPAAGSSPTASRPSPTTSASLTAGIPNQPPHDPAYPRERPEGRLRRLRAAQGDEGPHGGGHARASAGLARHAGQRVRPRRRREQWRRTLRLTAWRSSRHFPKLAGPGRARPRPPLPPRGPAEEADQERGVHAREHGRQPQGTQQP